MITSNKMLGGFLFICVCVQIFFETIDDFTRTTNACWCLVNKSLFCMKCRYISIKYVRFLGENNWGVLYKIFKYKLAGVS